MARKNIVIYRSLLMLIVILGGIWAGTLVFKKKGAPDYYQRGTRLTMEAERKWKKGNIQAALVDYKSALATFKLIGKRYPAWQSEGVPLPLLIKDCEEAIRLCKEAIRSGKEAIRLNEATARINLGHSYLEKQKYKDALYEYNIVLEEYKDLRQSYSMALVCTGIVYQQMGQYQEAINRYKIVLNEYRDQAESYTIAQTYLGGVYYKLGDYENALNAYKKAFNISRGYEQLYTQSLAGVGEVYRMMGKYKEARKAFQELTTKYPDSLEAKAIRSINEVLPVEAWQENMNQITYLKEAIAITQKFFSNQVSQKDFQNAFIAFDKKNENDALYVIGLKYQIMGDLGTAEKYYNECVSVSTKSNDKDLAYNAAMKALEHIRSQKR